MHALVQGASFLLLFRIKGPAGKGHHVLSVVLFEITVSKTVPVEQCHETVPVGCTYSVGFSA